MSTTQRVRERLGAFWPTPAVEKADRSRVARRLAQLFAAAAGGAALAHLVDPQRGARRRRYLGERTVGMTRKVMRRIARRGRATALQTFGHARGALHHLHPARPAALDDAGLAHKVESLLFRDARVPKGQISINAESGRVFLRGQLASGDLIEYVTRAAEKITGVDEVVNLLHVPGTEAPHPPARATADNR